LLGRAIPVIELLLFESVLALIALHMYLP